MLACCYFWIIILYDLGPTEVSSEDVSDGPSGVIGNLESKYNIIM